MAESTPRTWTLRKYGSHPPQAFRILGRELEFREVVEVIEKEPVLDLLERCVKHQNLGPLADFLKAHGRLKADSNE